MRCSFKAEFLKENGVLIGVNLGSDYCAEHEWGIKDINLAFGISEDDSIFGIERRVITKVPNLTWIEEKADYFRAPIKENGKYKHFRKKNIKIGGFGFSQYKFPEISLNDNNTLYAAWDSKSFMIVSSDPNQIEDLKQLYKEFANKNIAIWLGGGGVFKNAGLVFGVVDRIPEASLQIMEETDHKHYDARAYLDKTKIADKLVKAGKKLYAITAKKFPNGYEIWINDGRDVHGWFSLDQLEDWCNGQDLPK